MPDWMIMVLAILTVILGSFVGLLIFLGVPALAMYFIYRFIKYIHEKTT